MMGGKKWIGQMERVTVPILYYEYTGWIEVNASLMRQQGILARNRSEQC